jgi:ribosomal protein S18 acetylase RimI-like enzyme
VADRRRPLPCRDVSDVIIEIATEATQELADAFARLIPQLSKSSPPPTIAELAEMIESDSADVLIAREGDIIHGTLTLVTFRIPTGVRSWIEDVVVDDSARGKGVGDKLNRFALDIARAKGSKTVDLTSRPSREAANRLYQRLGFVPRQTNIYRYDV